MDENTEIIKVEGTIVEDQKNAGSSKKKALAIGGVAAGLAVAAGLVVKKILFKEEQDCADFSDEILGVDAESEEV